jgi:hypothetical protein
MIGLPKACWLQIMIQTMHSWESLEWPYTSIYHILMEKYAQLNNSAFFKNPMFGKYKIIALEYCRWLYSK